MIANKTKKIAMIHVAKKAVALDDECYVSLLMGAADIQSASALETEKQFTDIMSAFKKLGFTNTQKRGSQKGNLSDISLSQKRYAKLLWAHVSLKKDTDSLNSFIKRITGKSNAETLSKRQASDLINALKKMAKTQGLNPDALT